MEEIGARKLKLEICVDSIESYNNAKRAGADRVELCSALFADGLSPDIGLVAYACMDEKIEKFVMLRPRDGSFSYDEDEIKQIEKAIIAYKKYPINGFVFGALKMDGSLDLDLIKKIVKIAYPLPVSLHRAFDYSKDGEKVIDQLIDIGIIRILTSGKKAKAYDSLDLLSDINHKYGKDIEIMVGSGVNSKNIGDIFEKTKITNFHMSARTKVKSGSCYKSDMELASAGKFIASYEEIKKSKEILNRLEV